MHAREQISMGGASPPGISPALIGRVPERAALAQLREQAMRGQGQLVRVCGEAGVGKSRLIGAAKADALAHGFAVFQGACFPQDSACPYAPLLDLLRAGSTAETIASIMPSTDPLARVLFPLLPDLFPFGPDVPPLPALDPAQAQLRLFAALAQLFCRLAARQPLLLIFEDLHWSDDTSLAFLLTLARRLAALPLLVLLTYRNDEPRPPQAWLAQLDREHLTPEITLARLTHDEASALLRATLGYPQAAHPTLLATIYALTDGNPFFIEELLASLSAAGYLNRAGQGWDRTPLEDLPLPRSIHGLIQHRLAPLGSASRHVLALAAVAGRTFDLALLAHLVGWDAGRLLPALKEGIAAQLIVETSAGCFAFRHALTRQAIASDLLAHEHQTLHATIAAALEHTAGAMSATGLADLAYHCYEAGLWAKALDYALRAGAQAQALHDPRVALGQWDRVFAAASRLARPAEAAWYRARGDAHDLLGDFAAARDDYEMALTFAGATGDGGTEWQSLLDLGRLWAGHDYARAQAFFEQARDRAQALAEPTRYARSLNCIANWQVNTGHAPEGVQLHLAALPIFQAHHDRHGTAETLDQLGMAYSLAGDLPQAVAWYDQAVQAMEELADTHGLVYSLQGRGVFASPLVAETTAAALRARDACVSDVEESLRLARQMGALAAEAFAGMGAAYVYLSFGEFGLALARARVATQLASDIGHQQWMAGASFALGQVYLAVRAPDLAITQLEAALSLAQTLGSAWWIGNSSAYLALAHLLQGDTARAAAVLTAVLACEQPPRTVPERRVALVWSELVLAQGAPELALRIIDQLIATAPAAQPLQPIPALLLVKGEALLALRRVSGATRVLEQARDAALARQAPPLLWPIHAALARAHQRAHHDADALREFDAARAIVAALAATIEDSALGERFVGTANAALPFGMPAVVRRATAARFGGLTPRERQVAAQIAQGKSNRAIAAALTLGERTIETHLGNILAKLGFSSRAQIAVWAVAQNLARADP